MPYFVELAHHQPSSLDLKTSGRVTSIVLKALDSLHIENGASHSELKITDSGDIKVIEIGARMGGDFIGSNLVEISTGYDFLRGVIEVSFGVFEIPKVRNMGYSGVYFLSKEREDLRDIFSNWQNYPQIVIKGEITDDKLHYVSGDRSGYIIYKSTEKWICQ